jgi:ABC-type amino acid transport substrate-binding protein
MGLTKRLTVAMALVLIFGAAAVGAQKKTSSGRTLIVGTKEASPFAIKSRNGKWTGISIDLWREIATELKLSFKFRELDLQGLLDGVGDGSLDVAIAALTVTPEREKFLDFSHPYHVTGLGIAIAPKHRSPWLVVLSRFFSLHYLRVMIVLSLLLLTLGTLVWWFERKRNPQHFGGSTARGIGSGFWWSAVTMTTVGYGDKTPVTFGGRLVAFFWMLVAIIIISSLTASITSTLTVTQLESPIKGPEDLPRVRVGTIGGTTSESYLRDNLISYTSYETPTEGLRAITVDRIQAFVYDAPILRYLIHREFKGDLGVLPNTFDRQDYGIALPKGSPLREQINVVLLEKIREPAWQDTIYKYLGK